MVKISEIDNQIQALNKQKAEIIDGMEKSVLIIRFYSCQKCRQALSEAGNNLDADYNDGLKEKIDNHKAYCPKNF